MKKEINAKDITKMLVGTLSRYKEGEISSQDAYREAYLVNTILKGLEVSDIQERLSKIEETLGHD